MSEKKEATPGRSHSYVNKGTPLVNEVQSRWYALADLLPLEVRSIRKSTEAYVGVD